MQFRFLERELKNERIEFTSFDYLYMKAICEQHPRIWAQFEKVVQRVKQEKEE